ncbi:MAG: flagellar hook protein FlgE [Mesorhizobium sp.]
MSLYGMMRTGVSGMNAQANRLSTVADNIANSGTAGYKRADTQFSTMVVPSISGSYSSGGVNTSVRYAISQQGSLQYTTSVTDLAVNGNGMFVVQGNDGNSYLTRSGAFVPDGQGRLVNAAGFYLMGYPATGEGRAAVANGFAGLEQIRISQDTLTADPTTTGLLTANLNAAAEIVTGAPPSGNTVAASFTSKTSLVTYDNLGNEVLLDVYFTKTSANSWEVAVYNKADATPGANPFPYGSAAIHTSTMTFDPTNGSLTSSDVLSVTIPGGQPMEIDISGMTQLSGDFVVLDADANGSPPATIDKIMISQNGTLSAQYSNGTIRALYDIPLATARSNDMLSVRSGNVYAESAESGGIRLGFPNEGDMGILQSGALEESNADTAEELTLMIESQRSYTANSKVFQTGSELMDVLVNLKR